ncbi:MAG TPA: hypothetical protein VLK78_07020 [Candidatus Angelobacter sp.]|nr:hypothetical protein [Candidatus Angelobacter sp.]
MNNLHYLVATDKIELQESKRDHDIEFLLKIKKQDIQSLLHQMRQQFENDPIFTDILFYTFKDHIQILVKQDSYMTFILELFRWKLLKKIQWED